MTKVAGREGWKDYIWGLTGYGRTIALLAPSIGSKGDLKALNPTVMVVDALEPSIYIVLGARATS